MNIGNFLEILFISSFSTSFAKFSEFDAGNVILFQIKVFGGTIKETTLSRYFTKVTVRPSFTVIKGKIEYVKYQNRKYVTKIQWHLLLI